MLNLMAFNHTVPKLANSTLNINIQQICIMVNQIIGWRVSNHFNLVMLTIRSLLKQLQVSQIKIRYNFPNRN